jgi:transposase-like protein
MLCTMTSTPEEERAAALRAQADALRAVRQAADERDRIIAAAHAAVKRTAVQAARLGASRNRIREEAGVSPRILYGWREEAGLPVRPKRGGQTDD